MSRINLEALAKQHPDYASALRSLQSWIDAHDQERVINPMRVAKDLREVNTTDLAMAFTLLLEAGLLKRVYKVLTPAGVLADAEFDNPAAIPEKLPDRFERYFDTSDAEIVPFFRLAA
jgi:hypothetical protein